MKKAEPIDPTKNVLGLVRAAVERLDDLREAAAETLTAELDGLRREVANQVKFNEATRDYDLLAQRTADERHQASVLQLSGSIESTAETLRRTVSETASNLATQHNNTFERLAARLAEVEKNQYQDQGKQRLADPQTAELAAAVRALQESRAIVTGRGAGQSSIWGYISLAVGILLGLWALVEKLAR